VRYPYAQYAQICVGDYIMGGMEHTTATTLADTFLPDATVMPEWEGRSLIAHELAHQWFGDLLTCRDWSHGWLNEGFATYFDALWVEKSRGDSAFRVRREALRRKVMAAPVVAARPVIDTIETELMRLLNANSYQKGGLVLHMLRREIGDSAFFGAVRAYYAAHRHGNALTDDLRAAAERAAGRPLGWFFDQWLRRPGWPELAVKWSHDASARRVVLQVEQGGRFGAYRLPLRVRLEAGGVTRDTIVEVPASPAARVVIPLEVAARPSRVEVDPGADLLASIRLTP
jgi:aminopeptidase N